jgi:hypothetical protein
MGLLKIDTNQEFDEIEVVKLNETDIMTLLNYDENTDDLDKL